MLFPIATSAFFKINEKKLVKESVSDIIAYKIIEEVGIDTLKVAEKKVEYLKDTAKNK